MRITLTDLAALADDVSAVIHSLDGSIYQVTVTAGDTDRLLVDDAGKPLRWRSLSAARDALRHMPVTGLALHQLSAYDEMIGHPPRVEPNLLVIPLSKGY